jgi:hypothetical protein
VSCSIVRQAPFYDSVSEYDWKKEGWVRTVRREGWRTSVLGSAIETGWPRGRRSWWEHQEAQTWCSYQKRCRNWKIVEC